MFTLWKGDVKRLFRAVLCEWAERVIVIQGFYGLFFRVISYVYNNIGDEL